MYSSVTARTSLKCGDDLIIIKKARGYRAGAQSSKPRCPGCWQSDGVGVINGDSHGPCHGGLLSNLSPPRLGVNVAESRVVNMPSEKWEGPLHLPRVRRDAQPRDNSFAASCPGCLLMVRQELSNTPPPLPGPSQVLLTSQCCPSCAELR